MSYGHLMKILHQTDLSTDLSTLDHAWAEPPTFAYVPQKSGVPMSWIEQALDEIPQQFGARHFVLLTSGSTGTPKLVVGSRERAEALAATLHSLQDSAPVTGTVLTLPLTYCYAFVNQWLWARCHGRTLKATAGFSEPDELRTTLKGCVDVMLCVVGVQLPLLEQFFGGDSFSGVIRLHFAGGRFPQERLDIARRLFPNAAIFNNYGCAEAMPRLTLRRGEDGESAEDIGTPLPGVELRTSDTGELEFRSPFGAVGYIDDSGFHTVTPGTWVPTGDLGAHGRNGHWLLRGRVNEVFKRHGEKVALPLLLQTVAGGWSGQAAFYRENDVTGENGHVLVLAPHPTPQEVRGLLLAFRGAHPRARWPLRIESVGLLPTLSNGKVDVGDLGRIRDKIIHWKQVI